YLLNSINPFRIEGQKTIVLELLQQLDWTAPDWIVLPAGTLGNTAASGKALAEAREWGLISDTPRLAAVQAEGAAPFAASFREGFARRHRVEPHTVASAINIGNPASYDRAVRAIRETHGVVTTVPDEEILEAKAVVDGAGVGCEPASAASVAGARQLLRDGVIGREQRVVSVLTGHLLKDPDSVTRWDARCCTGTPPCRSRTSSHTRAMRSPTCSMGWPGKRRSARRCRTRSCRTASDYPPACSRRRSRPRGCRRAPWTRAAASSPTRRTAGRRRSRPIRTAARRPSWCRCSMPRWSPCWEATSPRRQAAGPRRWAGAAPTIPPRWWVPRWRLAKSRSGPT